MSRGATNRPAREPTCSPEKMKPMARERSLCLQMLATISVAEVGATPSPKPTKTLHKKMPAQMKASPMRNCWCGICRMIMQSSVKARWSSRSVQVGVQ